MSKHYYYEDDLDSPRYRDWAPTGLDPKGSYLLDRQSWFVAPVTITRDTQELVTLSNWESILDILGGESPTVEVHRFGHWGPGWFEIILVHPSRAKDLYEIEAALANYPVLDDEKLSELETEANDELLEGVLSDAKRFFQWFEHPLCHTVASSFFPYERSADLQDYCDDVQDDCLYELLREELDNYGMHIEHGCEGAYLSGNSAEIDEVFEAMAYRIIDGECCPEGTASSEKEDDDE